MPISPSVARRMVINAGLNPDEYDLSPDGSAYVRKIAAQPVISDNGTPQPKLTQPLGAGSTFVKEAIHSAPSAAMGGLGAAAGGALVGTLTGGPIGTIVGGIAGGLGLGMGTSYLQNKIEENVVPEYVQELGAAREAHPLAAFGGRLAAMPLGGMNPNLPNVAKAAGTTAEVAKRAMLERSMRAALAQTKPSDLANLGNVGVGAGLGTGMAVGSQLAQGRSLGESLTSLDTLEGLIGGSVFNKPNAIGRRMGFRDVVDSEMQHALAAARELRANAETVAPAKVGPTPEQLLAAEQAKTGLYEKKEGKPASLDKTDILTANQAAEQRGINPAKAAEMEAQRVAAAGLLTPEQIYQQKVQKELQRLQSLRRKADFEKATLELQQQQQNAQAEIAAAQAAKAQAKGRQQLQMKLGVQATPEAIAGRALAAPENRPATPRGNNKRVAKMQEELVDPLQDEADIIQERLERKNQDPEEAVAPMTDTELAQQVRAKGANVPVDDFVRTVFDAQAKTRGADVSPTDEPGSYALVSDQLKRMAAKIGTKEGSDTRAHEAIGHIFTRMLKLSPYKSDQQLYKQALTLAENSPELKAIQAKQQEAGAKVWDAEEFIANQQGLEWLMADPAVRGETANRKWFNDFKVKMKSLMGNANAADVRRLINYKWHNDAAFDTYFGKSIAEGAAGVGTRIEQANQDPRESMSPDEGFNSKEGDDILSNNEDIEVNDALPAKLPPPPEGYRRVKVVKPDGGSYEAFFNDKYYDMGEMGKFASIAKMTDGGLTHGATAKGETIQELPSQLYRRDQNPEEAMQPSKKLKDMSLVELAKLSDVRHTQMQQKLAERFNLEMVQERRHQSKISANRDELVRSMPKHLQGTDIIDLGIWYDDQNKGYTRRLNDTSTATHEALHSFLLDNRPLINELGQKLTASDIDFIANAMDYVNYPGLAGAARRYAATVHNAAVQGKNKPLYVTFDDGTKVSPWHLLNEVITQYGSKSFPPESGMKRFMQYFFGPEFERQINRIESNSRYGRARWDGETGKYYQDPSEAMAPKGRTRTKEEHVAQQKERNRKAREELLAIRGNIKNEKFAEPVNLVNKEGRPNLGKSTKSNVSLDTPLPSGDKLIDIIADPKAVMPGESMAEVELQDLPGAGSAKAVKPAKETLEERIARKADEQLARLSAAAPDSEAAQVVPKQVQAGEAVHTAELDHSYADMHDIIKQGLKDLADKREDLVAEYGEDGDPVANIDEKIKKQQKMLEWVSKQDPTKRVDLKSIQKVYQDPSEAMSPKEDIKSLSLAELSKTALNKHKQLQQKLAERFQLEMVTERRHQKKIEANYDAIEQSVPPMFRDPFSLDAGQWYDSENKGYTRRLNDTSTATHEALHGFILDNKPIINELAQRINATDYKFVGDMLGDIGYYDLARQAAEYSRTLELATEKGLQKPVYMTSVEGYKVTPWHLVNELFTQYAEGQLQKEPNVKRFIQHFFGPEFERQLNRIAASSRYGKAKWDDTTGKYYQNPSEAMTPRERIETLRKKQSAVAQQMHELQAKMQPLEAKVGALWESTGLNDEIGALAARAYSGDIQLGQDEIAYALHNLFKPYDVENAQLNDVLSTKFLPATGVSESAQHIWGQLRKQYPNETSDIERLYHTILNSAASKNLNQAEARLTEVLDLYDDYTKAIDGPMYGSIGRSGRRVDQNPSEAMQPRDKATFYAETGVVGRGLLHTIASEVDKLKQMSPVAGKAAETFLAKLRARRGELEGGFNYAIKKVRKAGNLKEYWFQDNDDYKAVVKWRDAMMDKGVEPFALTPTQQKINQVVSDSLKQSLDLRESFKDEGDIEGLARGTKGAPNYLPHVMSREASNVLAEQPTSTAAEKLYKEFMKYRTEVKGQTAAEAEKHWKTIRDSFNQLEEGNIASRFGAIDKAMGKGLPASMREQNLMDRMGRFNRRFARRVAYHEAIQRNPEAHDLLFNSTKGLASTRVGKNVLQDMFGIREHQEATRSALSGVVRAAMLGPLTGAKDVVAGQVLGFQHMGLLQVLPAKVAALRDWSKSYERAIKTGIVREGYGGLESGEGGLKNVQAVLMRSRDVINQVQGRQLLETASRVLNYGEGRYLVLDAFNAIRAGRLDGTKRGFLDDFVPDWQKYKKGEVPVEVIDEAAAKYVESVQGTYDYRGLPEVAMKGTLSPYLSLARWNIEKFNNFTKQVVQPATKGNYKPLLMATLGAFIGGTAVNALVAEVTGRKERTANWDEIANSKEQTGLIAYKLAALASLAGYSGMLGDLVKSSFDARYKNRVQSFSNPLVDAGGTILEDGKFLVQALQEGDMPAISDVLHLLASDFIQAYRVAIPHLSEEKQKELEDANNRRDLKVWKMGEGLPLADSTLTRPNPLINKDMRQFKETTDVAEAAGLLPALIDKAIKKATDENGMINPEILKAELSRYKRNSYQTVPSPERNPMAAGQYMDWLSKTQGADVASRRIEDYVRRNAINRAKSSMVPNL